MHVEKIYLHWSATPHTWLGNDYHTVINMSESDLFPGHTQNPDSKFENIWVHRLTPYTTELHGHTYARNKNSCSLAVACMGGSGWKDFPPTKQMIEVMCKETAKVAVGLKWKADMDFLENRVMTHAEAAGLRDYPLKLAALAPAKDRDADARLLSLNGVHLPHDNYGPSSWSGALNRQKWPGGTVSKWDLHQLTEHMPPGSGGYELRAKVVSWMKAISK